MSAKSIVTNYLICCTVMQGLSQYFLIIIQRNKLLFLLFCVIKVKVGVAAEAAGTTERDVGVAGHRGRAQANDRR